MSESIRTLLGSGKKNPRGKDATGLGVEGVHFIQQRKGESDAEFLVRKKEFERLKKQRQEQGKKAIRTMTMKRSR